MIFEVLQGLMEQTDWIIADAFLFLSLLFGGCFFYPLADQPKKCEIKLPPS